MVRNQAHVLDPRKKFVRREIGIVGGGRNWVKCGDEPRGCGRPDGVVGKIAVYNNCRPHLAKKSRPNIGRLESGYLSSSAPYEAVIHVARVKVVSDDCPRRIVANDESALASACAGARSIECRHTAVTIAQEAVIHVARINVVSNDRSRRIVA